MKRTRCELHSCFLIHQATHFSPCPRNHFSRFLEQGFHLCHCLDIKTAEVRSLQVHMLTGGGHRNSELTMAAAFVNKHPQRAFVRIFDDCYLHAVLLSCHITCSSKGLPAHATSELTCVAPNELQLSERAPCRPRLTSHIYNSPCHREAQRGYAQAQRTERGTHLCVVCSHVAGRFRVEGARKAVSPATGGTPVRPLPCGRAGATRPRPLLIIRRGIIA